MQSSQRREYRRYCRVSRVSWGLRTSTLTQRQRSSRQQFPATSAAASKTKLCKKLRFAITTPQAAWNPILMLTEIANMAPQLLPLASGLRPCTQMALLALTAALPSRRNSLQLLPTLSPSWSHR